ncbi:MAG: AAA family ATPase [Nitrospirota bacterium]|nr:MAG: AAA family ATPase [Nitrospirota bacterium]
MKHLLITGKPGVGKTTLIREMALRLTNYDPVGFYTGEIRVNGYREGFRLVSLDGQSGILSHVDQPGPYRVGRYGVDLAGFERFLNELDLVHSPSQLVILDEIGKMECLSTQFTTVLETLLNSSKLIIATIALRGEGFIQQVKQRPDCRLFSVTVENREGLVDTMMAELLQQLGTQEK